MSANTSLGASGRLFGPDVEPPRDAVVKAVSAAIAEDLGALGDLTAALLPAEATANCNLVARQEGVLAGSACALEAYLQIGGGVSLVFEVADGEKFTSGTVVARVSGPLRPVLTGERTALNFLSRLSGVATLTQRFVSAAKAVNRNVEIRDTRKTTPGLRALEKAAVRCGGGRNHRSDLSGGVLVKDNHLAGLSLHEAVSRARSLWPGHAIEAECDSFEQVVSAIEAGAKIVMLDNMSPTQAKDSVERIRKMGGGHEILVEVSGRINLDNVAEYAAAGVDLISVGSITHSAPIIDFGLDLAEAG